MPTVSVIIPAYNSARFLPEAIESVLAQTYKDYEIIVVDDGSTDNTKEVLAPYFDRIKYIYQQNQGAGSARNTGIKHSQGKYITFLDADDVWLPEKLHIQVDYLDNNRGIAMVYSRSFSMSEDGRSIIKKGRWSRKPPSGDVFNILFFHNFIPTSTVVVRKEVFNTIGLFDESLINSQDHDLWLRIARELNVAGISKPLSKYRHTSGSLRKNKCAMKFSRRVIEKHYKLSEELGRPIATTLYKKALARFFFHVGKQHLIWGDKEKALENFFQSLKYRPFNLRSIRYVLKTIVMQIISGRYGNELQAVQEMVHNVDGWLTTEEGKFLYRTAKNCHKGVIVEIGSFQGKSTIWLAKGSKAGNQVKIYAIDPHTGSSEHKERYGKVWTFEEFKRNIKNAKVEDIVFPIIKTSEEAEKAWNGKPIEFLWIDGAHEYEMVKLDLDKWLPHLIDGGVIAFHDTTTWLGPSRVVEENIYKSKIFKDIGRINSITFARKTGRTTLKDSLRNRWLLSNHFLAVGRHCRKESKQEAKKYILNAIKCNPVNIRVPLELIKLFIRK